MSEIFTPEQMNQILQKNGPAWDEHLSIVEETYKSMTDEALRLALSRAKQETIRSGSTSFKIREICTDAPGVDEMVCNRLKDLGFDVRYTSKNSIIGPLTTFYFGGYKDPFYTSPWLWIPLFALSLLLLILLS